MTDTDTTNRLRVTLAGIALESPLILASGILGVSASSMDLAARHGLGAVTTKSFCLEGRRGHQGPTIVAYEHGMLNAVGLSNPGWEGATAEIRAFKEQTDTPIIASIFGKTLEEFALVAAKAAEAGPHLIEVNVSCPNVADELGTPFEADPVALAKITSSVRKAAGKIPVSIKLSTNYGFIGRMAKVCEDHGADVITGINTVGPGMIIDVNVRRPVLSNRMGGVSGPGILPIAVRAVHDIARAVRLPIIGTGGVSSAEDALQLIMAGATAVGIGTALYWGLETIDKVNQGLERYLEREELSSLDPIRGAIHA